MRRFYYDGDVDFGVLEGRTVAVIGFGNQGSAQAMNLRDSGVEVVVGNVEDDYRGAMSSLSLLVWLFL